MEKLREFINRQNYFTTQRVTAKPKVGPPFFCRLLDQLKWSRKKRAIWSEENGNVLLIVAFSMGFLIAMLGLVIDLGMVYIEKSNLKKESTTIVISAAQELTNSQTQVHDVISKVLDSYHDGAIIDSQQIVMNQKVTVRLKKYVPYAFMALFGMKGITVEAESSAVLEPVGSIKGVAPLGIDESEQFVYGQATTLKVGSGDSTTGNFGILALEGNGASDYLTTLENGAIEPISIGETFNIKTGNVAGDTSKGVQYRINNSPYPDGETGYRGDPRIIPIIVYKAIDSSHIQVKGFAFFYLLDQGTDTSEINGEFIKYVENGTYVGGSLDRGAYMAKLVE